MSGPRPAHPRWLYGRSAGVRVHEAPTTAKIEDLKAYLRTTGIALKTHKTGVKSVDYANVLDQAKHREDIDNIRLMVLRSMSQAVYTPYNNGHFGLAYDAYVHFTSPIRRYPVFNPHFKTGLVEDVLARSDNHTALGRKVFETNTALFNGLFSKLFV